VSIETISLTGDIGESEPVELLLTARSSRVDGKKNWPGDEAPHGAHNDNNLEEAKVEVTVQRVMAKDVGVG